MCVCVCVCVCAKGLEIEGHDEQETFKASWFYSQNCKKKKTFPAFCFEKILKKIQKIDRK